MGTLQRRSQDPSTALTDTLDNSSDPYDAGAEADAVAILTELEEFRTWTSSEPGSGCAGRSSSIPAISTIRRRCDGSGSISGESDESRRIAHSLRRRRPRQSRRISMPWQFGAVSIHDRLLPRLKRIGSSRIASPYSGFLERLSTWFAPERKPLFVRLDGSICRSVGCRSASACDCRPDVQRSSLTLSRHKLPKIPRDHL